MPAAPLSSTDAYNLLHIYRVEGGCPADVARQMIELEPEAFDAANKELVDRGYVRNGDGIYRPTGKRPPRPEESPVALVNGRIPYLEAHLIDREVTDRALALNPPKDALRVLHALHVLLTTYSKDRDWLARSTIAERAHVSHNRTLERGIGWLVENRIVEVTTNGKTGKARKTFYRWIRDDEL